MRVPIENGSGFINQVSDLLSSLPLNGTEFKIYLKNYFISKLPEAVSSSPQKRGRYKRLFAKPWILI
jgi:hypothetical protein